MKTIVGVYESNEEAVEALHKLQEAGFPVAHLSVIGKAYLGNKHIHVRRNDKVETAEVGIGAVAGGLLGALTSFGIFAIPGLGLLDSAGAIVGTLAGAETGFIAGGIVAILTKLMGVGEHIAARYEKQLNENKFLLFAQGDKKQIKLAHEVLHTHGMSLELDTN